MSAHKDTYVCRIETDIRSQSRNKGGGKSKGRRESRDRSSSLDEDKKDNGLTTPCNGTQISGGRKTPSSSPLQRGNSQRKMMAKSISDIGRIERQNSSLSKQGGLSSGSSKFKWLLKAGSFPTPSLAHLEIERIIGTGLMGTVRIVKIKDKPLYCALKAIRKDYVVKHKDGRHIENERRIMLQLNSPFCIKLFGTFQDSVFLYFLMELAVGGRVIPQTQQERFFFCRNNQILRTRDILCNRTCAKLGLCL